MKNALSRVGLMVLGLTVVWAGIFAWKNLRGIGPAVGPIPSISPVGSTTPENTTGLPLALQEGFSISTLAKDLPGARVIKQDSFGHVWVSQPSEGRVTQIMISDGKATSQNGYSFDNRYLRKPHGLAFDPDHPFKLYIAEEHQIIAVYLESDGPIEKIADLPTGGRHTNWTLGVGPDERLYVSLGSSCNVCNEKDRRRGTIQSMNRDGSDLKEVAKGLRNAPFFTWDPGTNKMWATEMGRDLLGDDIPPDEINIIKAGGDYGWPICYGKNINDRDFDKNVYIQDPCTGRIPSHINLPAHSAPLGLAFIPDSPAWPKEYRGNLLVAFHGSWNRTVPTGYKIVRIVLDRNGNPTKTEDFISGWLTPKGEALGRPVDLIATDKGELYISDDKAGAVYRAVYVGK